MNERKRLIGILSYAASDAYSLDTRRDTEELADYLLANGVIVPPCKVGDTVYVHWSLTLARAKKVYPVKVYALRWDTKAKDRRICVEGEFEIDTYDGSYTHYYRANFGWDKVGKTLFLSREDAKIALAEKENKDA